MAAARFFNPRQGLVILAWPQGPEIREITCLPQATTDIEDADLKAIRNHPHASMVLKMLEPRGSAKSDRGIVHAPPEGAEATA